MLTYFYENDLIRFYDEPIANWEEAIAISCKNLLEKDIITAEYVQEIIECIKKYGPYIVIVPGVAMPHSSEDSHGVKGTAIAFTKMKDTVSFETGNSERDAKLFFTLAAKNKEEHTKNIGALADMLMTDGLIEALNNIENIDDYKKVMEEFNL